MRKKCPLLALTSRLFFDKTKAYSPLKDESEISCSSDDESESSQGVGIKLKLAFQDAINKIKDIEILSDSMVGRGRPF